MQSRGLLILLSVLAFVCVDLVAGSVILGLGPSISWPHPALGLLLALVCAQVGLMGTWAGLARRPLPWPVASALVMLVLWAVLLAGFLGKRLLIPVGGVDWLITFSAQTIAVVPLFWIARAFGLQVVALDGLGGAAKSGLARPIQFSIAYLLGCMTALALVLGVVQWALRRYFPSLGDSLWSYRADWLGDAVVGLGSAAIAWPAPWAVLGTRRRIAGALLVGLATGALVAVCCLLGATAEYRWTLGLFCIAQMALLVAVLGVFRVAGYRLVRRGKQRVQSEKCKVQSAK